jgi:single-strand DNA-binding protein
MAINASFVGNLGKDAELNQTKNGIFTNFSIAVNDPFLKEKTQWVSCSIYGERGIKLSEHLLQGTKVFVVGRLNLETFVKKSGETGAKLKMRVSDIEFAGSKPKEEVQDPQIREENSYSSFQDIPF